MRFVALLFCLFLSIGISYSQSESLIVFYNTENFFDTINDPNKNDDEFLPGSEAKWNSERYFRKINHIGQVMDSIGKGTMPAIIGFCEVENETCIKDLIANSHLKKGNYGFSVSNSPDPRSIDLALLYRKDLFTLQSMEEINAGDPTLGDYKTRNILYVCLKAQNGEFLHVFVNHWPSRREGEKESEPKRIYAAKQLKNKLESIQKNEPKAQFIIMGDFNDHPNNASIHDVLAASEKLKDKKGLYNRFYQLHESNQGSHFYDGKWGVLDQIIVSKSFLEKKGWYYDGKSGGAYKADFLLFKNNKTGEIKPNRTYSGTKYHGGYSDHLPVFIPLYKAK